MKPQIYSCKYVCVTVIVPKQWSDWFYDMISQDPPFSWGNNNRTMVDALSFAHHVQDRLDFQDEIKISQKTLKSFYKTLDDLEKQLIYIDLEN